MALPQNRAIAVRWFRAAGAQGNTQAAYFAKWLSDPTNNIGFRSNEEQRILVGERLPFAIGSDDPAGITFHNSGERVAWLSQLRTRQVAAERHARWQVMKDEYDSCKRSQGEDCRNPGPPPSQ